MERRYKQTGAPPQRRRLAAAAEWRRQLCGRTVRIFLATDSVCCSGSAMAGALQRAQAAAYSDRGPASTCSALRRCPGRCCGRRQQDQATARLLTLCCCLATRPLTNALLFNCNGGAQRAGELC